MERQEIFEQAKDNLIKQEKKMLKYTKNKQRLMELTPQI